MHARFSPRRHRFAYRLFYFAVDLDELDGLTQRLRWFSRDRANLYSFRDADFLPTGETMHHGPVSTQEARPSEPATLKERVVRYAAEQGVDLAGGRVVLVTLPRVGGYLFNPVSFYFCFDRAGAPVAAIAEVTNTFREMKPFFLGPGTSGPDGAAFRLRLPKHFYVSPFSEVDVAFDFTLRVPADQLSIQIDDYVGPERTLTTTLQGNRQPLTSGRLLWFTIKYPLITLRIIALIHWHAFCLWLKRVPCFPKAARAAEQRALYRPHVSLLPVTPSE